MGRIRPRPRLEALPFAELCIECQRKREEGRLDDFESVDAEYEAEEEADDE